ncbi:alpha/beta hydrolase [Rouxiella badensis]|jgi:predicted alpha/beta superfamily hydrolase|uniref:alpha/beta hydrolase n=1 Tax=Rouxiella badensis TaxID=1646377 RepID=UPI0003756C7E|nr:alpha/beta hydrolase-fold protein [Rouxiella badensis]QII38199.1 alpha/beta hydrolase [Rouxiella badensis]
MSNLLSSSKYPRIAPLLIAFFLTLFYTVNGYARPDMTPLGPNIADKGSAYYHFSVSTFDSADGRRHYKVWTGVPDKSAPPSGYPVLYLLDGNAAMDKLSEPVLKQLSAGTPPIIVAVGYQTPLPFEVNARAYDYTPPVRESHHQDLHGRENGGAQVFRHLLEKTIVPGVEKGLKIDPAKRGLWGHSYGGVFVLDTYLSSSSLFSRYYSTSPSLNRDYAVLVDRLGEIKKADFCNKSLSLYEGDDTPGKNIKSETAPEVLLKLRNTLAALHNQGLPVSYWSDPLLSHGQMFNASLPRALLNIAAEQQSNLKSTCP